MAQPLKKLASELIYADDKIKNNKQVKITSNVMHLYVRITIKYHATM